MKYVQAAHYRRGPRGVPVAWIVIHTAEVPETADMAERVAANFANPASPVASAHYVVDANSIVQCVLLKDIAFAAPGANRAGVQIELIGRAGQGTPGWSDTYSRAVLAQAAQLTAKLASQYAIPIARPNVQALAAGHRGIIGHADATLAFPGPGRTHTDPGPTFPWGEFLIATRYFQALPSV